MNLLSRLSGKYLLAARRFSSAQTLPTLTLYTKEDCFLCVEAKEVLSPYMTKFHYEEVDITAPGNEVWYELYKYDIPVLHINGKQLMKHRFLEKPLLDALEHASS